MGVDGVDMRLPADEGHVMPGPEQQSAIIASDRSGTDDCNLHAFLPFGGSSERASQGARECAADNEAQRNPPTRRERRVDYVFLLTNWPFTIN
jgi:hypothetical protein